MITAMVTVRSSSGGDDGWVMVIVVEVGISLRLNVLSCSVVHEA